MQFAPIIYWPFTALIVLVGGAIHAYHWLTGKPYPPPVRRSEGMW